MPKEAHKSEELVAQLRRIVVTMVQGMQQSATIRLTTFATRQAARLNV
ncbi:MAG: hypothetical protein AAFU80_09475 [Pseudomonadota bacterium]